MALLYCDSPYYVALDMMLIIEMIILCIHHLI